ncbi:hypothetical protein ACFX11_039865 [Malus domestica]
METKSHKQLHIFFFSYMVQGHLIPLINIARLFASRGVKSTLIAPLSMHISFPRQSKAARNWALNVIKFSTEEVGLPQGCKNCNLVTTWEMNRKFVNATFLLQPQIKQILDKHRPHCHVADTFFPWATDVAAKFDIPMILFHGMGFFALCASLSVVLYELHAKLSSDSEVFTIPNFPMEIKLTRSQMPTFPKQSSKFTKLFKKAMAGGETSYGFILLEIAAGLEAFGQEFIWVVKREKNDKEEWLIEGFEERLEGKGLIIRGWASQVPVLEHEATGAFVTHCGWNSILEGVSAGVPMIT